MVHFRANGHDLTACGAGGAAPSTRYRHAVDCQECLFALDEIRQSRRSDLLDLTVVGSGYCPVCGHRTTHWPGCPEAVAS